MVECDDFPSESVFYERMLDIQATFQLMLQVLSHSPQSENKALRTELSKQLKDKISEVEVAKQ